MAVIVPSLLVEHSASVFASDSVGVENVSIEKLSKLICSFPVLFAIQYLRFWMEPPADWTLTSSKTFVLPTHTSALSLPIDSVVALGAV